MFGYIDLKFSIFLVVALVTKTLKR